MPIEYFSHPLVIPNVVQAREYQIAISHTCLGQNSLVILPTGLGKTVIALMVMVERLTSGQKVVLVSPTKPLATQHVDYFTKVLPLTSVRLFTGELQASDRITEWNDAQLIIATPQTLENDLRNSVYSLVDVSLLIIDEAHRSVGGYAYTYLAKIYQDQATNPLILALTASPGGDEDKVNAIKDSLFIKHVELRTEDSEDVKPYLNEKEIVKLWLDLPDILYRASLVFKEIVQSRCKAVQEAGFNCKIIQHNCNSINSMYISLHLSLRKIVQGLNLPVSLARS